jgi:DNA topoisomerase-1
LVAKVQERGYVQVEDVVGLELGGTNFKLSGDEIEMTTAKQVFGAEKKKLVIQPLGTLVIEFLLAHFSDIFVYDYTQKMEGALDSISKGETVWHTLCRACHGELERLVGKVAPQGRQVIRIDANHVYTIAKYGPVIKCTEGKKVTFKPVRKDIDLAKLRAGGYALADLVDETRQTSGRVLGSYKNKDVILRKGKYGLYLNWDGKNISGRFLKKRQGDVRLEDVLDVLSGRRSTNPNVLLRLDGDAFSVRKGKYGPYIFRKTDSMAKPQFMNIPGAGREARDEWWRGRTREGIIAFVRSEYGL